MSTSTALYSSEMLKAANAAQFSSMQCKLDPALLAGLKHMKFEFMTPVQEQVLTKLPSMRSDCLVQAKTGTGKTIAFLLPAIQGTLQSPSPKGQVSILILSPTRELALQIAAEAQQLVLKMGTPLQVHTAFGGTAKASALEKFKRGDPKLLVATPGRLNDYLSEANIKAKFRNMKTLILDEADRMLDQGFLPAILEILGALPPKSGPSKWQGMCFSATFPPKMEKVFAHILTKDHTIISTIDKAEPPTLATVPQYSIVIPSVVDTLTALFSLLKVELQAAEGIPRIIVFGTTANLVALYANIFDGLLALPVYQLHSRMSQSARTKTTEEFKSNKRAGVLFASDVIGRGMDFPDVPLIIQVGLPMDADAYTHRVGRTARAGKGGRAILLLTEQESFFLNVNRQFPIKPYSNVGQIVADEASAATMKGELENEIDPTVKNKAYSAYLGFMKGFLNKLRLKPEELVAMANDFAINGMRCAELPEMEKKTIGKMGLKGVKGLRIALSAPGANTSAPNGPVRTQAQTNKRKVGDGNANAPPSRRQRHQGTPETKPTATTNQQGGGNREPGRRGGRGGRGGRSTGANRMAMPFNKLALGD